MRTPLDQEEIVHPAAVGEIDVSSRHWHGNTQGEIASPSFQLSSPAIPAEPLCMQRKRNRFSSGFGQHSQTARKNKRTLILIEKHLSEQAAQFKKLPDCLVSHRKDSTGLQ